MSTLFPDPETIAARLSTALPACTEGDVRIVACRLNEVVTGRRGKVFALADIDVTPGEGLGLSTRRLTIHAYPDGAVEEGRKVFRRIRRMAREQGTTGSLRSWAAFIPDARWLVVPFPFDYRLPHLVEACDVRAVGLALGAIGVDGRVTAATPVRYVPEKRCQVRYEMEGPHEASVIYGKTMADSGGTAVIEAMRQLHAHFAGSSVAGTPEPVGYLPAWQMVLQRGVGGDTLYESQRQGAVPPRLYQRIGRALLALQSATVQEPGVHDTSQELLLLEGMLAKRVLLPAQQARAVALHAALAATAPSTPDAHLVTSHRDFYDKQVLWDGDRLWLIDLDTLARAPHALDVGNFAAHIRLRERQGYVSPDASRAAHEAFLDGCESHSLEPGTLGWWTAASLLRLSVIYAVRPAWSHLAPLLLDDAVMALRGAHVHAWDEQDARQEVVA